MLKQARDLLVSALADLEKALVSLSVLVGSGFHAFLGHANQYPRSQIDFGTGPPSDPAARATRSTANATEIVDYYKAHRSQDLYELVHLRAVSLWDTFLVDLFGRALALHRSGMRPLPPTSKLDLKAVDIANLDLHDPLGQIFEAAQRTFSFAPFKTRIKIAEDVSGRRLETATRAAVLRQNWVRNRIAHHQGTVDKGDLQRELGQDSIQFLSEGPGIPYSIEDGDKIVLSMWDAEEGLAVFKQAARELVPDEPSTT